MKRFSIAMFAPVAALLNSAPAVASESAISNVRCFMLATVYARVGTDEQKKVAENARAFYLGRLSGPAANLQPRFAEQLKQLNDKNQATLMNQCVRAMATRAEEIRVMQQALARANRP